MNESAKTPDKIIHGGTNQVKNRYIQEEISYMILTE
jgi:hypothetical protein